VLQFVRETNANQGIENPVVRVSDQIRIQADENGESSPYFEQLAKPQFNALQQRPHNAF